MSHKEDSSIPMPCQSVPVDVGALSSSFPGFRAPSYTMVPDELFDDLMADLSGAALKVLLYIVRRTFGFKKQSDDISLAQICHGIITKEGRVLDHGTGLSKSTVQLALKELLAKNVLFATARVSVHRGHEATTYRLNIHSAADQVVAPPVPKIGLAPLAENRPSPVPKIGTGLYRKSVPQQTVEQQTDIAIESMPPTPADAVAQDEVAPQRNAASQHLSTRKKGRPAPSTPTPAPSPGGLSSPAPAVIPRRSSPEPALQLIPADPVAATLAEPIGALAQQLGDEAAPGASLTRACNLFHAAGVSLPEFLSRLDEAGARTRAYQTTIMGRGRDGQAPRGMPYLFAVLARLLGPEPAPVPAPPPTRSWRRPVGAAPARGVDTRRYTGGSYGVCEHCLCSPCEADCPAQIHDAPAADTPLTPQHVAGRTPVTPGSSYAHSS